MSNLISIDYKELATGAADRQNLPSLADNVSPEPQDHESEIARYLETAPSYSAMGKIVGDVLDPNAKAVLFPGSKTDGLYAWPSELAYYVRKYHLRIPKELREHMASRNWLPPKETEVDWKGIGLE